MRSVLGIKLWEWRVDPPTSPQVPRFPNCSLGNALPILSLYLDLCTPCSALGICLWSKVSREKLAKVM